MARSRRNKRDDKPKIQHIEAKTYNQKTLSYAKLLLFDTVYTLGTKPEDIHSQN